MRIVVFTDLHANLPALQAVFGAIQAKGCDVIFHTGDAIGIGPYPSESLDLLLGEPKVECVMGNHDAYFVEGLPQPRPEWMSAGEAMHQHWTHERLRSEQRSAMAGWPYVLKYEFEGVRTRFVHYGLTESERDFVPIEQYPNAEALDRILDGQDNELVFYGHHHGQSDQQGRTRYVNPGSLGCYQEAIARYCVVEFCRGEYEVKHRRVEYDDALLYKAFEDRAVPEREFIYRVFFGGRFGDI